MTFSIFKRKRAIRPVLAVIALCLVPAPRALADEPPSIPLAGMGAMVGEVTASGALVQVRLTQTDKLVDGDVPGAAGVVDFTLRPTSTEADQPADAFKLSVQATAERDFIARAAFAALQPGTEYICETSIRRDANADGDARPGPTVRFQTLAGPEAAAAMQFVVVTGMNYGKFHGDDRIDRRMHLIKNNIELPPPYDGPDKHLGYPALETILKLKPDFFVGTGDNVYYDTPPEPRARTVAELRQKWHEQFIQPRYRDLFAAVPTYWEIDDHDYRYDDCDNTTDEEPSPELARRMMLEQLPVAPADENEATAKTYRTHRLSRDVQIWLTENRMYRSPNAMPDGPKKSIWGADQKAWLKQSLLQSDAKFKLLISPTPMIGPDDARKSDNHTNLGGFRYERDEFFSWLKETGLDRQGFYILCGDRHWQYHAVDPSGIEEFSCGALVDANSRLGRLPGDPQSTDPEGSIKQPYTQSTPSGGFLHVKITPTDDKQSSTVTFLFRDTRGKLLYQHEKNH